MRLSAPLELQRGGSIPQSALTSDGEFVVFLADRDTPQRLELYSGAADARTQPVRLNDPLPVGQTILSWTIGAGDRVVYLVGNLMGSAGELFSHERAPVRGRDEEAVRAGAGRACRPGRLWRAQHEGADGYSFSDRQQSLHSSPDRR